MLNKNIEIKMFENAIDFNKHYYKDLWLIYRNIFKVDNKELQETKERLSKKRLTDKNNILLLLAYYKNEIAGFKIGYEEKDRVFYSWLGGVKKKYRKKNIASDLMNKQHKWCRTKGYLMVRTETKNIYREMLVLNIKNGFDIIDTFLNTNGEIKIILEKKL